MDVSLPDILRGRPNSERALLDILRKAMSDDDLRIISEAEHGYNADEHFAKLKTIRDTGDVPTRMKWHPCEALELIRWSRPEDPACRPGAFGLRGHRIRAFAGAAILRQEAGDDNGEDQYNLAGLLESCVELGPDYVIELERFTLWWLARFVDDAKIAPPCQDDYQQMVFYALSFLMAFSWNRENFRARNKSAEFYEILAPWIISLADEVCEETKALYHWKTHGYKWILDLSFNNLSHDIWASLARKTFLLRLDHFPAGIRDSIRHMGEMLAAPRAEGFDERWG